MGGRLEERLDRRISALGLGCMRFPGAALGRPDVERAAAIIGAAAERGVNYLDTAYLYPGNEACVGAALERLGLRERMLVATKLPHASCRREEDLDRILERQLERLRTDHIDCYLIHNITAPAQWERLRSLGIEPWLARQRAAGRLRSIGFSYHGSATDFPAMLDAYDWDFCQIQYNYVNERYQAGTAGLVAAHERGMAVFVMEPLLGGRLAQHLPDEARRILEAAAPPEADAGTRLRSVGGAQVVRDHGDGRLGEPMRARSDGRGPGQGAPELSTPAAWALSWVLNHPEVTMVLSGMTSPAQVEENAAIAAAAGPGALSRAQLEAIDQVVAVFQRLDRVGCTGCGYCMPCPRGINIPGCLAAYNASFAHSWFTGVQQYLTAAGLRTGKPALASRCVRCGRCSSRCPQGIEIPDRLRDVSRRLAPWHLGLF